MTLHEFLNACGGDEYVGLWNMDARPGDRKNRSSLFFETCPTHQSYFKIKNIPYGRIRRFLDMEVVAINHTEKGFLVRFSDRKRFYEKYNRELLAVEIGKEIERRRQA